MPVANDNCSNDTSIQVPKRKSEMRRLNRLALIAATFAILASVITTDSRADDKRAARILFVSQSAGFRHGSVTRQKQHYNDAARTLNSQNGFCVHASTAFILLRCPEVTITCITQSGNNKSCII